MTTPAQYCMSPCCGDCGVELECECRDEEEDGLAVNFSIKGKMLKLSLIHI